MWESFKEYVSTVWRHWKVLAVGVGPTLLSLGLKVLSSFWDFNFTVPWWLWAGVFVGALLVAGFLAFHDVRIKRDALSEEISNLHEANKPRLSFIDILRIASDDKRVGQIVLIKIKNVNGPEFRDCQVDLDSFTKHDGTKVFETLPVAICTEQRASGIGWASSPFNLSRGQSKHLYFATSPQAQTKYKPKILTKTGRYELKESGKYIARLKAFGGNAEPAVYPDFPDGLPI